MDELFDDEVMSQILARVPAEQVTSLKVMNKRWNSLISSDIFVRRFNSIIRPVFGLFHHSTGSKIIKFFSFDVNGKDILSSRNLFVTDGTGLTVLEPENPYRGPSVDIVASSGGLLLVRSGNKIYVCNPLTLSSKPIKLPWFYSDDDKPRFGLVINSINDPISRSLSNYKVICVYGHENILGFTIFSPETMKWRLSNWKFNCSGEEIFERLDSVYHRGALHWLSSTHILAFHVEEERSWKIELPPNMVIGCIGNCPNTWFGIAEEAVNILSISDKEIIVWVLEDYENSEWQIRRRIKKTWRNFTSDRISSIPTFYDGERLVLVLLKKVAGNYQYHALIKNIRSGAERTKRLEDWLGAPRKYIPYAGTLAKM
ncbi:uncharacterized protein LOC113351313 [Papaver somniferum]|uniref:uncharacterized protein LOC113351313 n=1 Tax=Papaver somniferum TaxID=3469 RepID=UPI000E6FDFDD|nr:uncharacterized protein LOC113351313 [Papaver somniferum]